MDKSVGEFTKNAAEELGKEVIYISILCEILENEKPKTAKKKMDRKKVDRIFWKVK